MLLYWFKPSAFYSTSLSAAVTRDVPCLAVISYSQCDRMAEVDPHNTGHTEVSSTKSAAQQPQQQNLHSRRLS